MSRGTAFAAAFALALLARPGTGSAAEAIVLQLSGPAQFEFAGYYAALWLGYYRDAGLDVVIRPGGTTGQTAIDAMREVAEGRAQFGIGTMQLVVRRAQGLPILLVAPVFQQSGAAIYYRADSDFSSPAALVNARLGRLAASDILDIELATALRAEGIDPTKIKSVTIDPGKAVAALADRTIDAVVGSAWTMPWQAQERGTVLKSFNPANYRVEYYGDSLFTMDRFATAEPQTVRNFRNASLKGWAYALQHPSEVITRLATDKAVPAVTDIAGFDRYQADVARRLSRFPEVPLGYSNDDRWTQIEAGMVGAGVLERAADLTGFVYNPGPEPSRDSGLVSLIALVAAAIGVIAVFGAVVRYGPWLWQRLPWPKPTIADPTAPDEPAPPPAVAMRRSRLRAVPPPAPTPVPAATDLNTLLAPLERRIRQRVRGKVRCRFSLIAELWSCRIKGGSVAATVLDLVGVAAGVMEADGTLIVGTRNFAFDEHNIADYPGARLGEFARITIRDSGPGLTDTQFEQILDPETSPRPAIAKAAAEIDRLGGFVRVESAEGVGTAVHLYFARVGDDSETETVPTAAVAE
jgi:ABC-type nitrate/sulfonate/bicarbonate transport system substrate-binding protein